MAIREQFVGVQLHVRTLQAITLTQLLCTAREHLADVALVGLNDAPQDLGEAVNNLLENLRHEDMPDVLVLTASICPASPFLLTSIADEVSDSGIQRTRLPCCLLWRRLCTTQQHSRAKQHVLHDATCICAFGKDLVPGASNCITGHVETDGVFCIRGVCARQCVRQRDCASLAV